MKLTNIALLVAAVSCIGMTTVVEANSLKSARGMAVHSNGSEVIGTIFMNKYGYSPLTAVIDIPSNRHLSNVKVTVLGKDEKGIDISYDVANSELLHHSGIPVFGLYADFQNKVKIDWKEDGKNRSHTFNMRTGGVKFTPEAEARTSYMLGEVKVEASKKFKDRLYLVDGFGDGAQRSIVSHNNPQASGAGLWDRSPTLSIYDTNGDLRWYMDYQAFRDANHYRKTGYVMGLKQVGKDLVWGAGQAYHRMSLMGEHVYSRDLPGQYADFSHDIHHRPNGNMIIRVAKKDYINEVGDRVTTVRDHIIEVDPQGKVVHEWNLNKILDNTRDVTLLGLDMGAVCLNVDADHANQTASLEQLKNSPYGDLPGVGAGRNWAHVNSVTYDENDNSIILSLRHQSANIKIGKDNEVKWILSAREGWKGELAKKVLQPIDNKGRKIECTAKGKCPNPDEFDFTWTQHTAYIGKGSGKHNFNLFVLDNGDGRFNEQPIMPEDKYTRAVEYVIDQQNMTVKQIWQYGKERGYEFYSPVTSITEYYPDKDSNLVASMSTGLYAGKTIGKILEFEHGKDKPSVEIWVHGMAPGAPGYRATIVTPPFNQ
ncbi:aryl-sulfate sulfotransferase [Shewanella sp. NKUCC05_KAH]|uniref:aryl-sulfate sulfotransferase n=1 Tax=Shewanella sp. NKUCC05_KAH TaxID=2842126 RepID=UPI001C5AB5E3|nr:aryl-sulfate sulfotransferase [Shewanella sp. NKUCC05_KAH]MBW3528656.1 aryl-sulfate sulfotransferase [Shewanella sp. NKUCC05_KAH]